MSSISKASDNGYDARRASMVDSQIRTNNVTSEAVIEAIESVAREDFVPEALRSVETGGFQDAVVETEPFRLAVLQEQLAVVGAAERVVDEAFQPHPVEPGTIEEEVIRGGEVGHRGALRDRVPSAERRLGLLQYGPALP